MPEDHVAVTCLPYRPPLLRSTSNAITTTLDRSETTPEAALAPSAFGYKRTPNFLRKLSYSQPTRPFQTVTLPSAKMAKYHFLRSDPGFERLAQMENNRQIYFRWTARTTRITLMYTVVVPFIFGYMFYKTDGLWNLRAKRKGDVIAER